MPEDKKGGGSEGGYFSRFVFSLLATVVTILLVQSSFSLIAPDIGGATPATFFGDFGAALGRIQFPELPGPPGIPSYLSDLFAQAAPPTGPTTLPPTVTPTAAVKKEGIPSWVWWVLGGIAALVALILGIPYLRGRERRETAAPPEQPALQIIRQIDDIINNKAQAIGNIMRIQGQKHAHITAGDMRTAIVQFIETVQRDPVYLWEEIRRINAQGDPVKQLGDMEEQLLNELTTLKGIEIDLHNVLNNQQWLAVLRNLGVQNLEQDINELNDLIYKNLTDQQKEELGRVIGYMNLYLRQSPTIPHGWTDEFIRIINDLGIIRLIIVCHNFEKHEEFLAENNLAPLFQERNVQQIIELLIKHKYATIKNLIRKLYQYDDIEGRAIEKLNEKVALQINKLRELRGKITERLQQQAGAAAQAQQQVAAGRTTNIQITSPQNNATFTLDPGTDQKRVLFEAQTTNLDVSPQNPHNYQWVRFRANPIDFLRDLQARNLGVTTTLLKGGVATATTIRDKINLSEGEYYVVLLLLDQNNILRYLSNHYVKVTISPATPTVAPAAPTGAAAGGGTLPIPQPLAPVVPPAGGRPSARIITPDPNSPENERTFTLDQNVTITGRVENLDMSAGREWVWTELGADGRYHDLTTVSQSSLNERNLTVLAGAFSEGQHTIAFYVLNVIPLPDGTHEDLKSGDIVIRIVPAGGSQPQQTPPTQLNQTQIDQALNSLAEMFRQELKR